MGKTKEGAWDWGRNSRHTFIEIWNFFVVADIYPGKVLDNGLDFGQHVVLDLALVVVFVAEADHHKAVRFGDDGLVDVPRMGQVEERERAHCFVRGRRWLTCSCFVAAGCCSLSPPLFVVVVRK